MNEKNMANECEFKVDYVCSLYNSLPETIIMKFDQIFIQLLRIVTIILFA